MSNEGDPIGYTRAEIATRLAEEGRIIPDLVLGRLACEDGPYTAEAIVETVADEGKIIGRVVAGHFGLDKER